ncbi:MAG: hypothetical protein GDA36_03525 [Rhodobacteraceae bacterium]|nr:hypothetical protein [Paracoccaceae bacterium]
MDGLGAAILSTCISLYFGFLRLGYFGEYGVSVRAGLEWARYSGCSEWKPTHGFRIFLIVDVTLAGLCRILRATTYTISRVEGMVERQVTEQIKRVQATTLALAFNEFCIALGFRNMQCRCNVSWPRTTMACRMKSGWHVGVSRALTKDGYQLVGALERIGLANYLVGICAIE